MLTIERTEQEVASVPPGTTDLSIDDFRRLARSAPDPRSTAVPDDAVSMAILIREVETALLNLFGRGLMNGTIHTCVGQEFSAVAVAGQLGEEDWVTSNHRCHGHFISKTGQWRSLIDELMGLRSGVCRGIGSSQHLYSKGFISNGVQGSLVPVGSGIALFLKRSATKNIVASFVGEGTLGEGVLYEAMNLAATWKLPQLFVCENNLYSQSTPQNVSISGTLAGRAAAFGIKCFETNSWDLNHVFSTARHAIGYVRQREEPAMLVVRTYRLNAHSKGDDDRSTEEVEFFRLHDPLNILLQEEMWCEVRTRIREEIDAHLNVSRREIFALKSYLVDQLPRTRSAERVKIENPKIRLVAALNRAYKKLADDGAIFIGEDIHDPYGGAFKVTKGIDEAHRDRVYTTPISEAGITGVATGLALMGERTFVEIMFGDFVTNAFDQLVNNIAKFHHMYAFQVSVPVRMRTPMGGKRGYGPTHSQSLEKFLVGIDNVAVIALSSLDDPSNALHEANELAGPLVIVENKIDYGRHLWQGSEDYESWKEGGALGSVVIAPRRRKATLTVVAYGETAREIADSLVAIFIETDEVVELVVPILLHPIDLGPIRSSIERTGQVIVVEDGSVHFGIGAEVIATLVERGVNAKFWRIGAEPVPIPSITELEKAILPGARKLIEALNAIRREQRK